MTAPPDSPAADADLSCPLCDYKLRGLIEPRCPECGYTFAWAELRDAKRGRHPWLFEHAARQPPRPLRNLRAFVATYIRSAWPLRFWRSVTPANPVHVGRLIAYWTIAAILPLLSFAIDPVQLTIYSARFNATQRATFTPVPGRPGNLSVPVTWDDPRLYVLISPRTGWVKSIPAAQLEGLIPTPWSIGFFRDAWQDYSKRDKGFTGHAVAIALAWPWLSLAALLVFQASMRRAKVNVRHLLRVAVYGCDFGLLFIVAAVVLYGPPIGPNGVIANAIPVRPFAPHSQPMVLAIYGCFVIATYRLTIGCAR